MLLCFGQQFQVVYIIYHTTLCPYLFQPSSCRLILDFPYQLQLSVASSIRLRSPSKYSKASNLIFSRYQHCFMKLQALSNLSTVAAFVEPSRSSCLSAYFIFYQNAQRIRLSLLRSKVTTSCQLSDHFCEVYTGYCIFDYGSTYEAINISQLREIKFLLLIS